MKQDKNERGRFTGRFRLYFVWPLWLSIPVAMLALLVDYSDRRNGIIAFVIVAAYITLALMLFFFRYAGLGREMISFGMEFAKNEKGMLKELVVPYCVIDGKGNILWYNDAFYDLYSKKGSLKHPIYEAIPELSPDAYPDMDVLDGEEKITIGDKDFKAVMRRNMEDNSALPGGGAMISIFFYDETEINTLIRENRDKQMIVGLLYIDNYEEALESIDEVRRSLLMALVDRKITRFMQGIDAVVRKLEKDKYIVIFRQKYLSELQVSRFSLLDDVKSVNIGNNMAVTISIGIGVSEESYSREFDYARAAIDMALARGGDQVVIKEKDHIQYYGGKSATQEKTTRVKARVKAHALSELIEVKDNVLIMGHKMADVDSVGAAIGVYRVAKTLNTKAHIVINDISTSTAPIIDMMNESGDYEDDLFIRSDRALEMVDSNTMLVVVDVNRQSYTECEELLSRVSTIVILDHHRQGEDVIQNAVLSYIEPYASSACEMVAEILQYIDGDVNIKPPEANAMYSGIMIDTNNFLVKTGVRTFEAAAFLRQKGADVTKIRKTFRSDMDAFKFRAQSISTADVYLEHYAFAECENTGVKNPTILGAQVANELMDISNIKASFVFTPYDGKIYISARSIDELNVQTVMEKIGGGGHMSVAGAQLTGVTVPEAMDKVKAVLDKMNEDGDLS